MLRKIAILILLALGFNVLVLTIVWIHHNMVTGLNPYLAPIFALLQLLLLAGCVWVGGRYIIGHLRKYIEFSLSTLFILAAVIMATTYLVDNFLFGTSSLYPDGIYHLDDTRFYVQLLFAVLFLVLAAAYRFFPMISHRTLNPTLGYIHFWLTLGCAYLLAYSHHYEGLAGMPRRYVDYSRWTLPNPNSFTHNTELILLAAQGLFLVNLFNSTAKPAIEKNT